jgi:DNA-binding NarL/FixJ family response regulator
MSAISVVIADRGRAGRAACRSLLEPEKGIRIVGEARSGLDAVTAIEKLKPSILLLDLDLFDGGARTTLLPVIRRRSPRTRVLLLTERTRDARTIDALCRGARGYLEKGTLRTYLCRAVRAVDAGEAWVPRKMVAKIMDRFAQARRSIPS